MYRSVTAIRRLVDEAAELTVRTALAYVSRNGGGGGGSGLGGGGGGGGGTGSWAAQVLNVSDCGLKLGYGGGIGSGNGWAGGGGRNVPMSATHLHRLCVFAVRKLAKAYKAEEIVASVMIMQKGTVSDHVAERVLKVGTYLLCDLLGKNVLSEYLPMDRPKKSGCATCAFLSRKDTLEVKVSQFLF